MKKYHWHVFWHEKLFEKHSQPHCQTRSYMHNLSYPRKEASVLSHTAHCWDILNKKKIEK